MHSPRHSEHKSELHFLHETVSQCIGMTVGRDAAWPVAPILASIPYSDRSIPSLEAFDSAVRRELPELTVHGRIRATKAFVSNANTTTKPRYISRLSIRSVR